MPRPDPLVPFLAAMAAIVTASNILVQYPVAHFGLDSLLTWGALTYPLAFLVNDLTNRRFGPVAARKVITLGFVLAVALSALLASPRIAIASGMAFLFAQLLDAGIFDRLRRHAWWKAPLISTLAGSIMDTAIFFSLAFAAQFAFLDTALGYQDGSLATLVGLMTITVPLWISLALGDLVVKLIVGCAMLAPYGLLVSRLGVPNVVPASSTKRNSRYRFL